MPTNLTRKVYTYVWAKDSMRCAEIIFDATDKEKFRFSGCKFKGVEKACWTEDEWEFIHDLSEEVLRLIKSEVI